MSDWLKIEEYYADSDCSQDYKNLCNNSVSRDFYVYLSDKFMPNLVSVFPCPKVYFDKHGYLPDCPLDIDDLFPGFKRYQHLEETTFYIRGQLEDVRLKLALRGFIEDSKYVDFMQSCGYETDNTYY